MRRLVAALLLIASPAIAQQAVPPQFSRGAVYSGSVLHPVGSSNTSFVMAGMAGSITPRTTGNVLLSLNAVCKISVANDAIGFNINYGTGTAPSNGAANTGTQAGAEVANNAYTAGPFMNCSTTTLVTGLTLGTTYWIDVSYQVIGAGGSTATLTNAQLSAIEN